MTEERGGGVRRVTLTVEAGQVEAFCPAIGRPLGLQASVSCCRRFQRGRVQPRCCDACGHTWVLHAVQKLRPSPPSSCSPVEAALPGPVFDLSSLVLYGAQAVPVRLKILLDRVFSVLTPEQVGHILLVLGWSVEDYVRGYVLQDASGTPLDRWLTASPEEELLVLQQFLRFGETRSIAESMCLQSAAALSQVTPPGHPAHFSVLQNKEPPGGTRGPDPDVCHRQESGRSWLLPLSSSSASQRVRRPPEVHTRRSVSPQVTPSERLLRRGGGAVKESSSTSGDHGAGAGEEVSPSSLFPPPPSLSCVLQQNFVSAPNRSHTSEGPSFAPFRRPPSFYPSPLCALPLPPRAAGQKGRVSCGICAKSFYDKGTLKIHYDAVHLKIKHGCTVVGCPMSFSSLRSRNRHSANPNPRLHTRAHLRPGDPRDTPPPPQCQDTPPRPRKIKDGSRNASGFRGLGGSGKISCVTGGMDAV